MEKGINNALKNTILNYNKGFVQMIKIMKKYKGNGHRSIQSQQKIVQMKKWKLDLKLNGNTCIQQQQRVPRMKMKESTPTTTRIEVLKYNKRFTHEKNSEKEIKKTTRKIFNFHLTMCWTDENEHNLTYKRMGEVKANCEVCSLRAPSFIPNDAFHALFVS